MKKPFLFFYSITLTTITLLASLLGQEATLVEPVQKAADSSLKMELLQGEQSEQLTSPLMVFGRGEKRAKESAEPNRKLTFEEQTEENRRNENLQAERDDSIVEAEENNSVNEESGEEQQPVTLDDFRKTLNDYPYAVRIIIKDTEDGERILHAQEKGQDETRGLAKAENMEIVSYLRALIHQQDPHLYDQIKFEDLFSLDLKKNSYPSLSAEKLRIIFERMDQEKINPHDDEERADLNRTNNDNKGSFLLGDHDAIILEEKNKLAKYLQSLIHKCLEEAMNASGRDSHKLSLEPLEPPITNFQEEEWIKWAERLSHAEKNFPSRKKLLADYGLSDPIWAADIVKNAFVTKLNQLQSSTVEDQEKLQRLNEGEALSHLRLPFRQKNSAELKLENIAILNAQKKINNTPDIEEPHLLDKVFEVEGGALLRKARKIIHATENHGEKIIQPQKAEPVITIPYNPSEEDRARWQAAKAIEELMEKRDQWLTETQSHRIAKIEKPTTRKIFHFVTFSSSEEQEATISQKKAEGDTASCTTSVTTKNTASKSLYSYTSVKSKFSTTSSLDGIHAPLTPAELNRFQSLTRELNKHADAWADLVRQADRKRRDSDGTRFSNEEALFAAWQEADEKAQAAEREKEEQRDQRAKIKKGERNWEMNTLRWEAREEADRLHEEIMEMQDDLKKTFVNSENVTEDSLVTWYQEKEKKWVELAYQTISQNLLPQSTDAVDIVYQLMARVIKKCLLAEKRKQIYEELTTANRSYVSLENERDNSNRYWIEEFKEVSKYCDQLKNKLKDIRSAYQKAKEEVNNFFIADACMSTPEQQVFQEQIIRQTTNLFHQDQAIISFWKKFNSPPIVEIDETPKKREKRLQQERGAYQIDLMEEKNRLIERCFKKSDEAEQKAQLSQEKYLKQRTPENRTELEQLYEKADQLEKKARQDYANQSLKRALEDARTKAEIAQQVWEFRAKQAAKELPEEKLSVVPSSQQQQQVLTLIVTPSFEMNPLRKAEALCEKEDADINDVEQHLFQDLHLLYTAQYGTAVAQALTKAEEKLVAARDHQTTLEQFQQKLEKEYNFNFRRVQRLKAVALVDQKALEAFQSEVKKLSEIEAVWKAQREMEKRRSSFDILRAVHEYRRGNKAPWEAFSFQEREKYNQDIDEANEIKKDTVYENLQKQAKEIDRLEKQLPSDGDLINFIMKSASYWNALEQENKQMKKYFVNMWTTEDERQRALRWGRITPQEREAEVNAKEGIDFYREAQLKEKDFEELYSKNFQEFSQEKIIEHWHKIVTRAKHVAEAWRVAAQKFKMGSGFVPDLTDIDMTWIRRCEELREKEKEWSQWILTCDAREASVTAWVIKGKLEEAPPVERVHLWEELLQAGKKAAVAWNKLQEYVEEDSSVTSERTFWKHWIATVDDLVFDDQKANTLFQNAKKIFDQAAIEKTEGAWVKAAEQAQVILNLIEQQRSSSALMKIQQAIWKQRKKIATIKATIFKVKNIYAPVLSKIQNYVDHPDHNIKIVYDAGAMTASQALIELESQIADLKNINLEPSERAALTARTIAAGAGAGIAGVAGGALLGGFIIAAMPITIIGMPGYIAYERIKSSSTAGEVATGGATGVGLAAAGAVGMGLGSWSLALAAGLSPIIGAGAWGTAAATMVSEHGYIDVYARSRSAEVMRSVMDADALHQVALAASEAAKNSFFEPSRLTRTITLPSAQQVTASTEAAARAHELALQSQGTLWEEEANWLKDVAAAIAAFSTALITETRF